MMHGDKVSVLDGRRPMNGTNRINLVLWFSQAIDRQASHARYQRTILLNFGLFRE